MSMICFCVYTFVCTYLHVCYVRFVRGLENLVCTRGCQAHETVPRPLTKRMHACMRIECDARCPDEDIECDARSPDEDNSITSEFTCTRTAFARCVAVTVT